MEAHGSQPTTSHMTFDSVMTLSSFIETVYYDTIVETASSRTYQLKGITVAITIKNDINSHSNL